MNKQKVKKILKIALVVFLCIMLISPSVSAMTSNYSGDVGTSVQDQESNNSTVLEKVGNFIQDLLLGALGKAIAAIGWVIEKLSALLVQLLTGADKAMFPWADQIIFNSIPLLDINFINPAKNSLFYGENSYSLIGESVRNIYFTGMSIGLGFLGIIVAVMAIRIAISSIASEKAKYKEAIVTWITALVLLFGLHYIISFTFYINEQMTSVAGNIVNTQIASTSDAKSVANLGEFFKENAFGEWNTESFIAAILYAVFVVQSLMFFYAYVKRLFYVVILAVIGPFVVVYDFLRKAVF